MNLIYLIDDDESILKSISKILIDQGYNVETFSTSESFLSRLKVQTPDIAIIDIFLGYNTMNGEDIIRMLTGNYPTVISIVISGESDVLKTLSCLKNGAIDFLDKPISLARLITSVKNAVTLYNSRNKMLFGSEIIGNSDSIILLKKTIKKLAMLKENILIYGESGTGKELIAENLHLFSDRNTKSICRVNCGALNSNLIESELFGHKKGSFTGADRDKIGYFELAQDSTLFIDEIGDFDLNLQVKILRVLEEKKITRVGETKEININAKLIFATHKNLEKMVKNGEFREDLFFRISTFVITSPPLRERLEDIELMAARFLNSFCRENNLEYKKLSDKAIIKLKEYNYPGNVRELIKIVKNAAYFCENEIIEPENIEFKSIDRDDSIWQITKDMSLNEGKKYFEKEFINRRLKKFDNNIKKTADSLKLIRNNLYRKIK